MTEDKGKAVNPAPLEDRMDRVERVLERVVEAMLIRETSQRESSRKKPRTESVKSGDASGTSNHPAKCPECKKYHRGVCFRKTGVCYRCGQWGHLIKNCPKGSRASKVLPTRAKNKLHGGIQLAETLHISPTQEEGFDRTLMAKEDLGKAKRKVNFEGEEVQVGNPSKKQATGSSSGWTQGGGNGSNNQIPECQTCHKRHRGVCHRASGACFRCGQKGHLLKDCPKGTTGSGTPATGKGGSSQGSTLKTDTGRHQERHLL